MAAIYACSQTLISFAQEDRESVRELDSYTVSAGPVPRLVNDFSQPSTILSAKELENQSAATLGALLSDQPGVSASSFGAGASRPIIRGFDGPRVKVLQAGLDATDVSSTSPDHAVSFEPLLTERIEIVRGPAALLYGSSAIGGVVNLVGAEIPREFREGDFAEGKVEARYDSVSNAETVLGVGTVGGENWAIRVTGLYRDAEDYDIPGLAEIHSEEEHHEDDEDHEDEEHHDDEHDEEESFGVLENSFLETETYSIGGTWFFDNSSYFGVSISQYDSLYGVPGHSHAHEHDEEEHHDEDEHEGEEEHGEEEEESVAIDLERTRLDFELTFGDLGEWIKALRLRAAYTDYGHIELEGDEIGTVFENETGEIRIEALHDSWLGADEGVLGAQWSITDFSADGEEAFAPPSETETFAVFADERILMDKASFEYGARLEQQDSDAESDAPEYSEWALSVALGVIYEIDDVNSIAISAQRAQRHPTATELFADGPHLATSQFEVGDPSLDIETAYSLDLSYRIDAPEWKGNLTLFVAEFDDYIFSENTGEEEDELPVYQFLAVDARFWGLEGEIDRIIEMDHGGVLELGVIGDIVRAENLNDSTDLPRIPPVRLGARLGYSLGGLEFKTLLREAWEQDRIAEFETETDGYTEWNAELSYSFAFSAGLDWAVFVRGSNLLDEEIRHHTSFLKDLAPLPGRNVTLGARVEF
ncbi:MAG: TonB-dependent receptor [Verrucomicrobiota bacterium]